MNFLQKFYTTKASDSTAKHNFFVFAVLIMLFFASVYVSLVIGTVNFLSPHNLISVFTLEESTPEFRILFYVRLPRIIACILSGSALAVSGVLIQAVLNNAMAAPNIIGVNSGAGFAVALVVALFPSALILVPLAAFIGALAACLLIYLIAKKTGASRMTITLVGIAISNILTAGITTIKTIFPSSLYNLSTFSIGGLAGVNFFVIKYAAPIIIICLCLAIIFARDIDVLSLGEETAYSLGMNVVKIRFLLLVIAAALAGAAVSFAGLLGFVGLVIPHIIRRIVGNRHGLLIPVSILCGAEFVLICDTLSRTLFSPYELPVGIIISFIGGPFFIGLILLQRRSKLYD